jgi:putative transposase
MRTEDLPLQVFNHAVWPADSDLSEWVHRSNRGSQYLSLTYTDRLAELGNASATPKQYAPAKAAGSTM